MKLQQQMNKQNIIYINLKLRKQQQKMFIFCKWNQRQQIY